MFNAILSLDKIRKPDYSMVMKKKLIHLVITILVGLLAGILAKLADLIPDNIIPGLSDIFTYFGVWILICSILACFSRSPFAAGMHCFSFLGSMVTSYYLFQSQLLYYFSWQYFIYWIFLSACAFVGGSLLWYARGTGWIAACIAAVPTAGLLSEAYSQTYVFPLHSILLFFDLAAAVLLFCILPINRKQRLRLLPFLVGIFILLNLVPILQTFYII